MNFTIITINPISHKPSLESISIEVSDILKTLIPISFVNYSTFKAATESEPISLYIMDKTDKDVMAQEIKDVKTMQKTFFGKKKLGSFTTPMTSTFSPRFMTLDVHDISADGFKDKYAVRLTMNDKLPISQYSIAKDLSILLSEKYTTTVFSVGKELNENIEVVSQFEKKRAIVHALSRANTGLIGQYTKANGISINKILARLDRNVEVLMAPRDLEEYEGMLRDQQSSLKYIESLDSNSQSRELRQVKTDIAMLNSEINSLLELIKEEPKVKSHYLRVFDPKTLVKYKIQNVQLKESKKEIWA